jgi:hypothetical protein
MQSRDEIRAILGRWRVQWQEWPKGEKAYRLVGVREVEHVEAMVRVIDQDLQALDGVPVLFHYPEDYPDTLNLANYKWDPPFDVGDVVLAEGGLAKMVMSNNWIVGTFHDGATRTIKTAVLVADPEYPSDTLKSVGMLTGDEHSKSHGALRFTFQLVDPDYVPAQQQLAEIRQMLANLGMRVTNLEQQAMSMREVGYTEPKK